MNTIFTPLPWWQTGVVYQIYPRSFQDSNADGIGDLDGITQRLAYLNGGPDALGVDAIWISPFYPSPMADFGYDVADYCDVHPMFGDLAAFDRLTAEAHRLGIRVIIDYVPNHTSDQHAWFIESRASRNNPKRDWYIWRDAKPDGSPPNNWGSAFGGPAWQFDPPTGQYYLHTFLKEQPDLNWRNPEVRAAMLDVLRFWLGRGVDGFRMDVIGMIFKAPGLPDNPPNPNAAPDLPEADVMGRLLNIYNENQDEVFDVLREIRQLLDGRGDRVGIGEVWYPLKRWIQYYGANNDGLHLPFNFSLLNTPWEADAVRRSVDELEAALPSFAWPNYVLGNHDGPRLASRIGPAQTRIAAMLLLTLRGTPTLYYGDEIGLPNGVIPSDKIQDPWGWVFPEKNRDIARTPMQWDASPQAGFSPVEPWLPVTSDCAQRNVSVQDKDASSLLNLYRKLLRLRRMQPALNRGSYAALEAGASNVYAYIRRSGGERKLIVLNFSSEPRSAHLDVRGGATVLLSTYLDRSGPVPLNNIEMRPNEGLILDLVEGVV
jgi:alpha-glucosidase